MNRITAYIRQSLQESYPQEEIKALSMLICCDMLGLDALDIYMGKDIILSECKQRELENIIFRLQKNEPILGFQSTRLNQGLSPVGGRSRSRHCHEHLDRTPQVCVHLCFVVRFFAARHLEGGEAQIPLRDLVTVIKEC